MSFEYNRTDCPKTYPVLNHVIEATRRDLSKVAHVLRLLFPQWYESGCSA